REAAWELPQLGWPRPRSCCFTPSAHPHPLRCEEPSPPPGEGRASITMKEPRMRAAVKRPLLVFASAGTMLVSLAIAGLPQAYSTGVQALVSEGSPTDHHPQNAQNEPAMAVDPLHPATLVAGANDLVD